MDIETVKDKIRKLLALSKSPNMAEAEAALSKANALMDQYHLDTASCQQKPVVEDLERIRFQYAWRNCLVNAICDLYGVVPFWTAQQGYSICGDSMYCFLAREMYTYLVKSIDRIANAKFPITRAGRFSNYSCKIGMAQELADKIRTLSQAVSWAAERPARLKSSDTYLATIVKMVPTKASKMNLSVDPAAARRGASMAGDISLCKQTTGSGGRQIGFSGKK